MFIGGVRKVRSEKQAEQAAEDLKKAAEAVTQAQQAGRRRAKGMADMAKAMQGMAAALGGKAADGKPVEPVAFRDAADRAAQVSGWEMDEPARRAHDVADRLLAGRNRRTRTATPRSR